MRTHRAYMALCLLLAALVACSCAPRKPPNPADQESYDREVYESNLERKSYYTQRVANLQKRIETLQSLRRNRDSLREQLLSGHGNIEMLKELHSIDSEITALAGGKDDDALHSELREAEEILRNANDALKSMRVPRSLPEEKEERGGGGGGGC